MSQDDAAPRTLEDFLLSWQAPMAWAALMKKVFERLQNDPADLAAWAELAMFFGDNCAPELCFLSCMHGRRLARAKLEDQSEVEHRDFWDRLDARLSAHQALAALDLGLATLDASVGQASWVPESEGISTENDSSGQVQPRLELVGAWLERALRAFDGDAAGAAHASLMLAAWRLGLVAGPAQPSVNELARFELWHVCTPNVSASVD